MRLDPPAPVRERIALRPGRNYVWIPGYYAWRESRYDWVGARWDRPPYVGARWRPGRWVRDPNGWYFTDGRWYRRRR